MRHLLACLFLLLGLSPAYAQFNGTSGIFALNSMTFGLGTTPKILTGGTGYLVGDTITLSCPSNDTPIVTKPVLTVTSVSSGAVTGISLTNPGFATAIPSSGTPSQPNGVCNFVQLSTSGSGSGASFFGAFAFNGLAASLGVGANGDASGLTVNSRLLGKIETGWAVTPYEYGTVGAGADAAAINAAIAAVSVVGGRVIIPNRGATWALEAPIILQSNVEVECTGRPMLKLNNGVNTNTIEGYNFRAWLGIWGPYGIQNFGIRGCIIDGNRANNTTPVDAYAGNGVVFVGREFLLDNLIIQNTAMIGLWSEYAGGNMGGGTSPYGGHISHLTTNYTGTDGWYSRVSDTHLVDANFRDAGQNGTALAPVGAGLHVGVGGCPHMSDANEWNTTGFQAYGVLIESDGCNITGMHIESGRIANIAITGQNNQLDSIMSYSNYAGTGLPARNLWILGNRNRVSGIITIGTGDPTATGVTIGGTYNGTLYTPTAYNLDLTIGGYNNLIDWTNDGGNGYANLYSYTTGAVSVGNSSPTSIVNIRGTGQSFGTSYANSILIGAGAQVTQTNATAIGHDSLATDYNCAALGPWSFCNQNGHIDFSTNKFTTKGDSDWKLVHWMGTTTNATAAQIFTDNVSAQAHVYGNFSWSGDIEVVGRRTDSVHKVVCWYRITDFQASSTGAALFIDNAGTTTGKVTTSCSAPAVAVSGTNLSLTVTGAAGATIEWTAYGKFVQTGG